MRGQIYQRNSQISFVIGKQCRDKGIDQSVYQSYRRYHIENDASRLEFAIHAVSPRTVVVNVHSQRETASLFLSNQMNPGQQVQNRQRVSTNHYPDGIQPVRMIVCERKRKYRAVHKIHTKSQQQQVTNHLVFLAEHSDQHHDAIGKNAIANPPRADQSAIIDHGQRWRKLLSELHWIYPEFVGEVNDHQRREDTNGEGKKGFVNFETSHYFRASCSCQWVSISTISSGVVGVRAG